MVNNLWFLPNFANHKMGFLRASPESEKESPSEFLLDNTHLALPNKIIARFGFERFLGLGHILWVPLLVYVLIRLPSIDGYYKSYLIALSIAIGISLVFDTIDVWRYFSIRRNAKQSFRVELYTCGSRRVALGYLYRS